MMQPQRMPTVTRTIAQPATGMATYVTQAQGYAAPASMTVPAPMTTAQPFILQPGTFVAAPPAVPRPAQSIAAPAGVIYSQAPASAGAVYPRSSVVQPQPPAYVKALEKRIAALEVANANKTHGAFVFVKPHACTEETLNLVKEQLSVNGIYVLSEGFIAAEDIDAKGLIDAHYGAIASKAVKQKPAELTVQPEAKDKFAQMFGLSWEDALASGKVFNAMDAAEVLGVAPDGIGAKWATLTKDVDLLKFGGGFYCGKVDDIFVINGFYMDMRGNFTQPGKAIYYFETEWDPRSLCWADFRGKVLGPTDPAKAPEGSMRNLIYTHWQALGLAAEPNTGDNGVHASASPFEALAERMNWLEQGLEEDFYGRALLTEIPANKLKEWLKDPAVNFEGKKQSVFDLLEDLDSRDCFRKCVDILKEN
eukprot:gb/GFBE01017515.1/.p1 GENE.gb/GFBE01017515.1/~~gb/GFBE01017515.1/.p1  ORF type:complete len:421 (+),score=131.88 gb/GFBE01017515.1/:1-1263(+)